MTKKTFTLTIEQIKGIYEAGVYRGEEQRKCGGNNLNGFYANCIDELYNIVNEGVGPEERRYVGYGVVKEWFK